MAQSGDVISKRIIQFVIYLLIAVSVGLAVVLFIGNIENVEDEKKLRREVRREVENAIAASKTSFRGVTADQTLDFLRKYVKKAMSNKLIAVDTGANEKLDRSVAKYLFTFHEGTRGIDIYIKNTYVQEEVFNPDYPQIVEGIVTTLLVFTTLAILAERRKRTRVMKEQFETRQAELTKELNEKEALALLGRMTATLAHELRTPIATISNLVQVLPERFSDARFTQRFMVLMTEELYRTQQIIDNLLLYGKEIAITDARWIDLKPFVTEISEKIGIKLSSCSEARVYGDTFYMRLFMDNLFRNSVQAGADTVSLTVRTPSPDNKSVAEIVYEDNGSGFPAQTDINGLIAPFVTTRSKGAGLGLYLTQKIALAHGGMLSLSRLVKGACITFVLPREKVRIG